MEFKKVYPFVSRAIELIGLMYNRLTMEDKLSHKKAILKYLKTTNICKASAKGIFAEVYWQWITQTYPTELAGKLGRVGLILRQELQSEIRVNEKRAKSYPRVKLQVKILGHECENTMSQESEKTNHVSV